jgi:trans-aconitate 2-methyltransferase
MLFQMGGKDNAHDIFEVLNDMLREEPWRKFFSDLSFPYGFYEPEEYTEWLLEAKLKPERAELLKKDMKLPGKAGLAGWIRTTWLPYRERLPYEFGVAFIAKIIDTYLEEHPLDAACNAHVAMVRLEIEASKPALAK